MRKTGLFLVICLLLAFNNIYASDTGGKVKGYVLDSKTNEPIEFVNVSVKKVNTEGALPVGVTTDKNGRFEIDNLPYGKYLISVSYIGYTPFEKEISVTSSSALIDLSGIILSENTMMMDEVKVVGMRSQMKIDIDKKVFSIDQNIASTGGTATDILSNIPSVEVDNDGSISLKGSSSVTVWINGKASGMTADNRAQILEQLPAETIEKIEVITNPSAKYSPEGTAGIINIVLKKDRKAGYYGSVQAGVDTRGSYNLSSNYNYNSSKLDAYASVSFRSRRNKSGSFSDRIYYSDIDTTFLNQESEGRNNGSHLFSRAGATWHFTPVDHLTIGGILMLGNGLNKTDVNYISNVQNSFISRSRNSSSDDDMMGGNAELGYKHEFGTDHYLDFTLSFNKWGMDATTLYNQNSVYDDYSNISSFQKQTRDINNKGLEIQLDYLNKVSENRKIEAGYKGTLNREDSPVETFSGTIEDDALPQTALFNRFLYDIDIHALYGTYSGKINSFGYQLGLRGEYSHITTRSPGYGQTPEDVDPFAKDYLSLFPSLFLSYSLPGNNELQMSYTRRISRPWGGQLNSFVNITDSTNISFGNPYLLPQFSNAFELNYIKSWDKHVISFALGYRNTDNVIQSISYLEDNIMKTTYENISRSSATGMELVLKDELFKILETTTTVYVYYYQLDGFSYTPSGSSYTISGAGDENFAWSGKLIANFKLPKAYSVQLTGSYDSRQVIAQGYRKAGYTVDGGIRKSFDKMSLSINARDIFNSRKRKTYTSGMGYSQVGESWRGGRQIGITATYSFGNMKPKKMNRENMQQQDPNQGYNMENNEL